MGRGGVRAERDPELSPRIALVGERVWKSPCSQTTTFGLCRLRPAHQFRPAKGSEVDRRL